MKLVFHTSNVLVGSRLNIIQKYEKRSVKPVTYLCQLVENTFQQYDCHGYHSVCNIPSLSIIQLCNGKAKPV